MSVNLTLSVIMPFIEIKRSYLLLYLNINNILVYNEKYILSRKIVTFQSPIL